MNRQILFKAKRKDWEELPKDQWWVEGDLLHTRYDDIVLISNFEDQLFRCDGNTVCQFTGLHDNTKWGDLTEAEKESFLSDWNYREDRKNKIEDWSGRKIWENDILRGYQYPYRSDGNDNYFAEVTWFENCPAFGIYTFKNPKSNVCGISEGNTEFMENWNSEDWEVICNIFDNADLLEAE